MSGPTSTRHAWLIGASHGIGRALAEQLAAEGWQLTLSARTPGPLLEVASPLSARALPLDATDPQALHEAAQRVFQDTPPQLVLMNVGDYQPMPLEQFDVALFERLNRSNYLAAVYLLDAVLPRMRDAGGGQLLLNASASAYCGLPNAAPYSAPKAALLNMAESLQPQLQAWNIQLRVINPGFVRSRLTARNDFPMPFLMDPQQAAERILRGLHRNSFEISFPRRLIWLLKLLRCLPYPLYFALMRKVAGQ